MARIDWVEQRLHNWALWRLKKGGGGVLGYAAVDLTKFADMDTGRGSLYASSAVPISNVEASATDDAVARLPSELRATVEVAYLSAGLEREKLARLCCTRATMHARIGRAHRLLADHWTAQQQRAQAERERVERLAQIERARVDAMVQAERERRERLDALEAQRSRGGDAVDDAG